MTSHRRRINLFNGNSRRWVSKLGYYKKIRKMVCKLMICLLNFTKLVYLLIWKLSWADHKQAFYSPVAFCIWKLTISISYSTCHKNILFLSKGQIWGKLQHGWRPGEIQPWWCHGLLHQTWVWGNWPTGQGWNISQGFVRPWHLHLPRKCSGEGNEFYFVNNVCLKTLIVFPSSGQSYKASMIVIYDSRIVPDWKIPHITTLES